MDCRSHHFTVPFFGCASSLLIDIRLRTKLFAPTALATKLGEVIKEAARGAKAENNVIIIESLMT